MRRAHPHDQAQGLASLERFAKGLLGAGAIVGMNDVEKRLLPQFREVPARGTPVRRGSIRSSGTRPARAD